MMTKRDMFEMRFSQEMGTRQNMVDTKLKVQKNDERRMKEFWRRRKIFDREYLCHQDEPVIIRLSWGLSCYLAEKDIWIEDEQLAGNYGFTEYRHSHFISYMEGYDEFVKDSRLGLPTDVPLLEEAITLQKVCAAAIGGGLHVVGGFQRALELGIEGMIAALDESIAKNGETEFLRAGKIVINAARLYFLRYADYIMYEAALESDADRKERLMTMAKTCSWIVDKAPETFREALQLVTLMHEVIQIEERCGSLSFGRFDKYMYPYYQRDIDAGILTTDEAQQLIDSFWMKLAQNRWGWQNITLGGYDDQAGFCDNAITRMCLSATRRLKRDQPQVTFRCHPSMSDDLWDDIIEVIRTGVGFPSLYNDELCVKAKERIGIPHEDAQQYAVLGCVELTIPEKEYSHCEGIRLNLPKLLELCLMGGKCLASGVEVNLSAKRNLDTFDTFEDFYHWFKGELIRFVRTLSDAADEVQICYGRHYPIPFLSATMESCIQSGLDATQSGAVYNNSSINVCGQATLIDSLSSIRRFVFEEKRYTLRELAGMIESDFAGKENERLYIARHCPRFGSDPDNAELMRDLMGFMCDDVLLRSNRRGGVHQFGFYSVEAQTNYGLQTGATPDGRHAFEPLSNGFAPTQGTEKEGPTAVFEAVSRMDCSYLSNGMALDLKFHPRFFNSRTHREKFRDAVKTYFALGGMQTQINVVSRETLLAAQEHPDQFRDLVVRVSGFSAYFCDLSPAVQDEIILRTEFEEI